MASGELKAKGSMDAIWMKQQRAEQPIKEGGWVMTEDKGWRAGTWAGVIG